ncbi:MAG: DNA polymerase III subunit beta [Sulfuricurvum sp.]|jgi:DNA polymerase-3 subunit beta
MKITIKKSVLENMLINAQAFVEKKDLSQITSHILIKADTNTLTIKATDYEIGLEASTTKVDIIDDGTTTANGKKLLDIVRILKDNEIILELKNEILHITQAHSKFKLPTFSYLDFPKFPSIDEKSKISINSSKLIESLKKITPSIDINNPKFELNGALIDIKDDSISFVSTDTRRLSIVTIPNQSNSPLNIIIPKKAIIEIQKLFFDDIELLFDETYLLIKSNEYTFYTKLINGKFPEYTRIIPKDLKVNLTLPKALIVDALKQITTISQDVQITFYDNNITFESLSDDNIEAKTDLNFPTTFDKEFSIALNSRYLLDFLNSINNSEFELGLNEHNLPFMLQDGDLRTIVMPIVL